MLKREKEGRPLTFYHYMIDLTGGPCIYKRISGCGSGTEYMAVTPWGDLYPCHQFVGDEKYKLGDILTVFQTRKFRTNLSFVTHTPVPTAKTAGQDFIAAAVVPQTLIMQQAQSQVFTNTAVSFSEKEWNVPL